MRRWAWLLLRLFGKCLAWIAALVAVGIAALEILFVKTGATLDDELASARLAGVPTEVADLRRLAYVDPGANAAPLYQRAILQAGRARGALPPGFPKAIGQSYPPISDKERNRLLCEGLPRLKPAFDSLARAAKMPGVDWNRRWELGYDLTFPEHAEM